MIFKLPKTHIGIQKQENFIFESAKVITKSDIYESLKPWIRKVQNIKPYSFAVFDSYIFNNEKRLKGFIDKLNEIVSQDPTFNLADFLSKEINVLFQNNSSASEDHYYSALIRDLDNEFIKSKDKLKLDITNFLLKKAKSIFQEFNLSQNLANQAFSDLKDDIDNYIYISNEWKFIRDLVNNIINNNEENKENSYQISGFPGFYKTSFWANEFENVFKNIGAYGKTKPDDFSKIVLYSISRVYKASELNPIVDKSKNIFEYKDLYKLFRNESYSPLDKVDFLFPGSKKAIKKLINHNGSDIGNLTLNNNYFDENTSKMPIKLDWEYGDKSYSLIDQTITVVNSVSPVQKAKNLFVKWYSNINNQIKSTGNFTFRALAQSQKLNITNDAFYKKLKSSKTKNEMSIDDFTNFLKLSGQNYTLLKDKIEEIRNTKKELQLGYKIDYQIDDANNNFLIRLKIFDNTKTKLDDNDEDQVVYINISKPSSAFGAFGPSIRIKLISDEIKQLINKQLITIKEQDIGNLDITQKNAHIDPNYFSALEINNRNIDQILNKYSGFGLDIKDIKIKSLLQMNKGLFSIISTIQDYFWKKAAPFSSSFNVVNIKTINEQLEDSGILNVIHDYSGAPNSLFDKKGLKNNEDGPQVTKQEVNDQLKIIQKKYQIINQGKIIDRIENIFNNTNKEIDFGFNFPVTIKWITEKSGVQGHGIAWKFRLHGVDITSNKKIEKDSKDYNVVYDFIAATNKEKNDSKNIIKTLGDKSIKQLNDNSLVIDEKINDVKDAIETIEGIVGDYEKMVDNDSDGWSKTTLKKEEEKAIKEINKIYQIINKEIGPSSIVKKVSEVLDRNLKTKEINAVKKEALLFANLLKITKNKKIFEEMLKNKKLLEKLSPFSQKPFLKDALKTLLKISTNYKYLYLGVGIFSGLASLVGVGAFASSIRASKRLKRMNGTQAKIKGIKLISAITAFVTMGSMGASIATMIWFFITKGGI